MHFRPLFGRSKTGKMHLGFGVTEAPQGKRRLGSMSIGVVALKVGSSSLPRPHIIAAVVRCDLQRVE